jgi:gamma-glutamyltranspeptidase/glutathione hydrolase
VTRAGLSLLLILGACRTAPLGPGAVAAPEPLAAHVGAEVLRGGGNAVDAAVAVSFALAVTLPAAGNLGGGGFMVLDLGDGPTAIDYRERAPAAAARDMYLDARGEVQPDRSLYGAAAAGVPGTVAGLWTAHRKFGSRPWADLVAPVIRLAEDGFVLDERRAREFAATAREMDRHGLNFGRYFHGAAGERFRQPELAETLRRVAERGPDGFYDGPTAERIVQQMKRGGGLISREDLGAYRAVVREPVRARVGDLTIVSMPPPSSGGVALIQMLKMIEGAPLPPRQSAAYLHRVAEIEKRVFADRSEFLGDPDFVRVPTARLIADDYVRSRAASIRADARTAPERVAAGRPESEQTTHFSIVDRRGGAAAVTTTLNDSYGCGVVVEGAGFLLNNEMDDFSAKPGAPNLYGVIGGSANAIEPGKRMLSSMTPTLVYREGRLWLVLGTPGGPTIFTSVFQVIMNRHRFGMTLAEAVAAPRFHHQWPPREGDPIWVERGAEPPAAVAEALRAMGYTITVRGPLGDVQAVEIGPDGPIAVSDPRGIGTGIGGIH